MTEHPSKAWETPEQSDRLRALAREYREQLLSHRRSFSDQPPKIENFRPDMMYICQVCVAQVAAWPREKKHTFRFPFGYTWTVAYVTPMVCTNCRMMRHAETRQLGDGRRRFWKRAVALWIGESYPSTGPGMSRLFAYRETGWVAALAVSQLLQMIREDLGRWMKRSAR